MLDRSTGSRALSAAFAVLCLLPATASATAVPADAPTIAGAWDSGQSAIVFAHGQQVCMALQPAGAPRPTRLEDDGDCVDTPVLGPFGRQAIATHRDAEHYVELGVVGAATARVQLRETGAVVATTATQPSPLPGAVTPLRFYVLTAPGTLKVDEIALLDTFDAVQRAIDPAAPAQFRSTAPYVPQPAPGPVLRRGAFRGQRWTLRTRVDHPLAGTPLLPERRVAAACASFGTRFSDQALCDEDARAGEPVLVKAGEACAPVGRYVSVLARRAVRAVVVVDGAGRRRRVPLSAVPGTTDGIRAGVLVLGDGLAVRRVEALGAGGRTLQRVPQGLEPSRSAGNCGASETFITVYGASLQLHGPLGRGPHTPRFAESGPRLCVTIDRAPRPSGPCALPPVDASEAFLTAVPTADGRYVAGLVPRTVALARLILADGTHRDVTPLPVPGQYAGVTRLVAADVPGTRRVVGYRLLDEAGRALQTVDYGPEPVARRHRTVLAAHAAPGLGPIVAAQIPARQGSGPFTCTTTLTTDLDEGCDIALPGSVSARVLCAPRRIVLVGALHRATQRLVVRTASGREIVARTLRLPSALRRPSRGAGLSSAATIAVAVLPADQAPRRLLRRGPDSLSVDFVLPAARAQCGYESFAEMTTLLR